MAKTTNSRAGIAALTLASFTFALAPHALGDTRSGDDPEDIDSPGAEPPPGAAKGPPRVAAAVFMLPDPGIDVAAAATIERAIEHGLRDNNKLSIKDKDKLLAAFAGEVPEDAINDAHASEESGLRLLDLGRPAEAIPKLEAAVGALEKVLAYVKKKELADAQMALGVARGRSGDSDGATREFARLLTWRPTQAYDVQRYGGELLQTYEQTRASMPDAARGSLEIHSDPAGAQVFVNGRYVGATPATVEGLVAGYHYVTLKLAGYRPAVIKAHVDARFQETAQYKLVGSEKYLLVDQSLARAKKGLGLDDADPGMLDLRAFLFVDHAVFARLKVTGARYEVNAYLYDLRTKKRLSQAHSAPFLIKDAKASLGNLAHALYLGVRYDGVVERPKVAAAHHGSVLGKWWFWGGLGLVAATTATIVIVSSKSSSGPSCQGGADCVEVKF